MKIIIVGCGKVGSDIASKLAKEKHDIVLIDEKEEVVNYLSNEYDALGLVGNGASFSILKQAGVEDADVLIAITGSDETNMLTCVFARKYSKCKTIARVRNPLFSEETKFISEQLGISLIINPELEAAKEFYSLLNFPSAIEVDTFARGKVDLLSFVIPSNSVLINKKIKEVIPSLKVSVLFVGIERGTDAIIPNGDTELKEGDIISIIIEAKNADKFFKKIGIASKKVKSVLLVGGGTLNYYLSKSLIEDRIKTKIIEISKEKSMELAEALEDATVIRADGTKQETLVEEGIDKVDGFVSATNIDEENIVLSLYAKQLSKAKVLTKLNRQQYTAILTNLDVGSVIYPKKITSDRIIQYVRALSNAEGNNVETLYKILNDKAEAISFKISEDSEVCNIPLENLSLKDNTLICSIVRKGTIITPRGRDVIKVGDAVLVVTTNKGFKDIKDIIK